MNESEREEQMCIRSREPIQASPSIPVSHEPRGWLWMSVLGVCWLAFSVGVLWNARPAHCKRSETLFVGAHQCRGCHAADYKVWEASAHAKAFSVLPAKDRNNKQCLQCHSVGTEPHLQGVQCESCHGGGKYYVVPEVMSDPVLARAVGLKVERGKVGCAGCHVGHSPKLRKFDYAKMWKKVAHGAGMKAP